MIKLSRLPKPSFLTPAKVKELTDKYIENGTNVWNNDEIKTPLLASSYEKCAYCECHINEESKYMEVEHFEDKHNNPNKVVEWENLLPSCKKCNGTKGTHDVISEPIINPYIDEPKEHLSLRGYRLKHKTEQGEMSIHVHGLNDSERLVQKRFDIGNKLSETIENAKDKYESYLSQKTTLRKNKFVAIMENLLKECQSTSIYSATTSTILHTDDIFIELVNKMKDNDLWSDELESLYNNSVALSLDYV